MKIDEGEGSGNEQVDKENSVQSQADSGEPDTCQKKVKGKEKRDDEQKTSFDSELYVSGHVLEETC